MLNWICWKLRRILPNSVVAKLYIRAGLDWGDAQSYIFMGPCVGYEKLVHWYCSWDGEMMDRGLVRWTPEAFVLMGGGYTDSFMEAEKIARDECYYSVSESPESSRHTDAVNGGGS